MIFSLQNTRLYHVSCNTKNGRAKITTDSINPEAIYKIVLPQDYNPSNIINCVNLTKLDRESGFIHLAYGKQVKTVAKKFFKAHEKILLLQLNIEILQKHGAKLRLETNKPGGTIFPHLYNTQKISAKAIIKTILVIQ